MIKERCKIFIFENAKTKKDEENLVRFRNLLKNHSISAILVSLCDLSSKLSGNNEDSAIEEISMLKNNPDNLPIIFYGGPSYRYFTGFLCSCEWEDREDMQWIKDPWDINTLKEIIEEMSEER